MDVSPRDAFHSSHSQTIYVVVTILVWCAIRYYRCPLPVAMRRMGERAVVFTSWFNQIVKHVPTDTLICADRGHLDQHKKARNGQFISELPRPEVRVNWIVVSVHGVTISEIASFFLTFWSFGPLVLGVSVDRLQKVQWPAGPLDLKIQWPDGKIQWPWHPGTRLASTLSISKHMTIIK